MTIRRLHHSFESIFCIFNVYTFRRSSIPTMSRAQNIPLSHFFFLTSWNSSEDLQIFVTSALPSFRLDNRQHRAQQYNKYDYHACRLQNASQYLALLCMHDQLILHVYVKRTLITINCWLCVTVSRYEGFFLRCVPSIYYVNTGRAPRGTMPLQRPIIRPPCHRARHPPPTSRTVAQNVNNIHNKFVLSYLL